MTTPKEAREMLWKATVAVEESNAVEAMKAVGMTLDLIKDTSIEEAVGVFNVRVHDLVKIIREGN
jgi:hypothetical protein